MPACIEADLLQVWIVCATMTQYGNDLSSLVEGTRFLTSRLGTTMVIVASGTLLAVLSVLLQVNIDLPILSVLMPVHVDSSISHVLAVVLAVVLVMMSQLPLVMYVIPRFLAYVDAQAGGNPLNALDGWELRFKERWLRAFVGNVILVVTVHVACCLFMPLGALTLLVFGWVPLRILLRGESVSQAAKGSFDMMKRAWHKMFVDAIILTTIYSIAIAITVFIAALFIKRPIARQWLVSPAVWLSGFMGSAINLWVSACFLSLYRRIEKISSKN